MTIPQYLASEGLNPSQFARQIGVKRSLAYGWADGALPRGNNIKKVIDGTNGKVTANDIFGIRAPRQKRKRAPVRKSA